MRFKRSFGAASKYAEKIVGGLSSVELVRVLKGRWWFDDVSTQ